MIFQVDQAESEDQEFCWHQQERCDDSDLDCAHHSSHDCLLQVHGKVRHEPITNTEINSANLFVRKNIKDLFEPEIYTQAGQIGTQLYFNFK